MIRFLTRPMATESRRFFTAGHRVFNGSVFGELTKNEAKPLDITSPAEPTEDVEITPKNDQALKEYYMNEAVKNQISENKLLTPLKIELFKLNLQQNGFFKNHQIIKTPEGKHYRLSLTEKEIDLLEPTIYLQSYRLKSSMKKATVVNRFVRGLNVKNAINQLHFNPKKMSTELEKLLKKAVGQANELGLDENALYIQALWTGSDGGWVKRLDPKGRGRIGIIHHKYVHLKVIIKTDVTKKRIAWEKANRKATQIPKLGLNNEPLNFRNVPFYKW